MAILTPDLEKAKAMKQKPTPGELYLLEFLEKNLSPVSEVFFQPCFNGDRPDVVIMEKGLGVIVIEVKCRRRLNFDPPGMRLKTWTVYAMSPKLLR